MFIHSLSRIAGILIDHNQEENKNIFNFAIQTANKEILQDEEFQLKGIVKEIKYGNDLEASKSACKLLRVSEISSAIQPTDHCYEFLICDL